MSAQETLAKIASEVSECKNCALHNTRTLSVPGEGPASSEIMLIGEGPGATEDAQGHPFIGAAGKFLVELLAGAGLKRTDVFICNVVKCRPPMNRDPLPEELAACNLFLDRQISAINPKIIITLGRFSMAKFMPNVKISQVHGQMRRIKMAEVRSENSPEPRHEERFVIAMFHPAAALHQAALKPVILADFARLPQMLEVARKEIAKPVTQNEVPVNQTAVMVSEPKGLFEKSEHPKQMKLF